MRLTTILIALALAAAAVARADDDLNVPLAVTERASVHRVFNHVDAGFPLPEGKVKNVNQLGLFILDDKDRAEPVPAAFFARELWPKDKSVRWATVHFLASPEAEGTQRYVVRREPGGRFAHPVKVEGDRNRVTVDTGKVRFTVDRRNFNLLGEVKFDPEGKGAYKGPSIVPAGSARLLLTARAGGWEVSKKVASVDVLGQSMDYQPQADKLEVEERHPGRVVVKITGTFKSGLTPALDFVARIYAQADSGTIRISFTVLNTHGRRWEDFVGIEHLAFILPTALELKKQKTLQYALSTHEDQPVEGAVGGEDEATLLQPTSETHLYGGVASGSGPSKSVGTRRVGWASATGDNASVAAGIRDFWQMHPKAVRVGGDGSLTVELVPLQAEPAKMPAGSFSQPLQRIDLAAGAARTHEFAVAFVPPGERPEQQAMSIVDPLRAVAPTWWYCQCTRAEGLLWDTHTVDFPEEHRKLLDTFNAAAAKRLAALAAARDGRATGVEGYGMLNFGDWAAERRHGRPADWLNTRWAGHAYGFTRAALVHFWRTGDPAAWDLARSTGMHLADMGIVHHYPGADDRRGAVRAAPNMGHFRRIWSGAAFGVADKLNTLSAEGLYDLYRMTGDAWYLDAGTLVSAYCRNNTGAALPAAAARASGLFEFYRHTLKKEDLMADVAWVGEMILPLPAQRKWDDPWTYGLAVEQAMHLREATGDEKWGKAAVEAAESLLANYATNGEMYHKPGATLPVFGWAHQVSGEKKYLDRGLVLLRRAAAAPPTDDPAEFALAWRLSPYYLHFLSNLHADGQTALPLPPEAERPADEPEDDKNKRPDGVPSLRDLLNP